MHENEILVFLLGSIVWVFIGIFRHSLSALPARQWLYAAYFALWLAWAATNLEHLLLPVVFDFIEHLGYAINGVLLFVWCWLGLKNNRVARHV